MRSIIVYSIALCAVCVSHIAFAATLYVVGSENLRGVSLSASDVKHILLGEMSMLNKGRIRLIYPDYSSPEIETLSRFVGKGGSVRNLKAYWSKMIFTGKGNPPYTANSATELKSMLQENNSIGVWPESAGMYVIYTINE